MSDLVDENTPRWFNYGVWRFVMHFVVPLAMGMIVFAVIRGSDFS